jgi:peptide/nickel transport system permease protein
MLTYIARRLAFSIFVLLAAATIIFVVIRAVPGNPAQVLLGPSATPDEIAALTQKLGLNQPFPIQYVKFILGVLHLDFGNSSQFGVPAWPLVLERVPASAELAGVAMLLVLVTAFAVGPLLAQVPGSVADRVGTMAILLIQGLPGFWVGILLLLAFVDRLHLLPPFGNGGWENFVMPAITLAFPFAAVMTRFVRAGVIEVLSSGYIQVARAKGLGRMRIFYKHVLRNMLITILTVAGVQMGLLFSGAAIVETVFDWPGVGQLLLNAITYRDYGLVEADIFLFAAAYVGINFIVDILYGYVDPRVRSARAGV